MRRFALTVAAAAVALPLVHASCPTAYGQISSFLSVCRAQTVQLTCLTNLGDCSSTGPGGMFANCNQTLTQLFTSLDAGTTCTASLGSIAPPDQIAATLAASDCSSTLASYINRVCDPNLCPGAAELNNLLPLANCLVAVPGSLDPSALASYSAYACLQNAEGTKGVPSECQAGSSIDLYRECTSTTETVVEQILGQNTSASAACSQILLGPLTKYCSWNFGAAIVDFCTPTFCQNPFPGNTLDMCTGIGVVVGTLLGSFVLGLGLVFFLRWRRRKLSLLSGSLGGSQGNLVPLQGYSPTMGGGSPKSPGMGSPSKTLPGASGFAKQPSFGALPPGMPGMSPMGSLQGGFMPPGMSAAAYMTPGGTMPAPPAPVAAVALDPATLTMRKGQLCDFYTFNDPTRDNIPDHVDRLFEKYSFESIRSAVKQKYGIAPAGWDSL